MAATASASQKPTVKVEVVNLDIPFGQMIWLLIKWAIAAIPAMIILFLIGTVIAAVLAAVLGGTLMGLGLGR